ncbi:hypothetical protein JVU11DRAFT_9936 [Chiua virens]|nr:hypothetical protein JVU11DRAFT_9936 [Chiua virens]
MFGRQSVRVTYAHKRKRVQAANKAQLSSPLEALPPEMDDLTRTQMARRMLKRSRRVALAENFEAKDKNVEHIRDHLAKRIKRTQEHISNVDSAVPFNTLSDDLSFQTPFSTPQSVHDSALPRPPVPDQLSPVPVAKRVMTRTSSRSLKENGAHSQILASPFSSRPGSAAPSPKHQVKGRSSRRVSRIPLNTKSRTLSGVFKENARHVPRKGSTASLKEPNKEPVAARIMRQRYRSSPSTSYMRAQFAQDEWISPPKAISRALDGNELHSPGGSVHSNGSFYTDQPRSCSTPATSRLRKLSKRHGRRTEVDNFPVASSLPKDSTEAGNLDVEMMDGTVLQRRQTIHLSSNSIFTSSGEFTVATLPVNNGRTRGEIVEESQVGRTLAGSFLAEFEIPLSDSPVLTTATKMLDSGSVPKASFGKAPFGLPGTSPVHGGNLIVRRYRNPPSSPAGDLAEELSSMGIRGGQNKHLVAETHRPSAAVPLHGRSRSSQDAPAKTSTRKSVNRKSARNRASTIRASEFARPGVSPSDVASRSTASLLPNARRTRSGTVVGPNSKLATKDAGLSAGTAQGIEAVEPESEELDDELLLKSCWIEDVEYLGLPALANRKEVEADEMNLGGLWHGLEFGPPRQLGLRRR